MTNPTTQDLQAADVLADLGVRPLDSDEARALDAAGYLVVPRVLDDDGLRAALDRIDELVVEAPAKDPMWRPRETLHLDDLIDEGPAFDAAWRCPAVLAAVAHLLGPDFWVPSLGYRAPSPGHGAQVLHRQSGPVGTTVEHDLVTAIVALVDFRPDNGSTRVIPGSHLVRMAVPDEVGAPHPDEQSVLCQAGDALVFTEHLFHSGTTNRSTLRRHALIARYQRRGTGYGHHAFPIGTATVDRLDDAALLLIP